MLTDIQNIATALPNPPSASGPPGLCVLLAVPADASVDEFVAALTAEGHEAQTANDGGSAVEAARVRQPDVVVCAVDLPGGARLPAALREQAAWRRPLIVVLADAGAEGLADADLVVARPASAASLLRLLRRFADVVADSRAFDPVI